MEKEPCVLVLEDGRTFKGRAMGAKGRATGEVVFNTSMTGYQEILTDPSYAGQIVMMTYPHIGNYGVNAADMESRRPFLTGFVVREESAIFSSWRAESSLDDFLRKHNIVGICGIDTRALTKHIREAGAMRGVISSETVDAENLVQEAKDSPEIKGLDLVKGVTVSKPYQCGKDQGVQRVAAFDFGMKANIPRSLAQRGVTVEVIPASWGVEEVMKLEPDGIFLSNGPGDPEGVPYAVDVIRSLLGRKPLFGICLGHQLLALALGGRTYKLKFGHRGANHPVKNLATDRVEITTQNHGFAVDAQSLSGLPDKWGSVEVTHVNLNDDTVEGLRCPQLKAFSVQYHPEASPGPHDSGYLFDEFIESLKNGQLTKPSA